MQIRKEIDGLRAVAVISVVMFHAGLSGFDGGYVGVDVFFVISGFLITKIIISEMQDGNFSIVNFYERRARRILPALFFVMLCTLPFAVLWMLPYELENYGRSIIAVTTFSANFLFWRESGYFAGHADEMPLLHTWSLAVEEQYYLLFPIFVIVFWRFGIKSLTILICLTIAGGLAITEWAYWNRPIANFYLLPTRAWELEIGSLLAILQGTLVPIKKYWNQFGSALGLIFILFAVIFFDNKTPFPSYMALLPVTGSALVIQCAVPGTFVNRLLSLPPLAGLGLISYSVYLWHHPLFAFARIQSIVPLTSDLFATLVVASLILAWFTWRFVERPFRQKELYMRRQIFVGATLTSVVAVTFGFVLIVFDGFINQYPAYQRQMVSQSPNQRGKYVRSGYNNRAMNARFSQEKKSLLIIGDSFSQDLYNIISESGAFQDFDISVKYIATKCQIHYGKYLGIDAVKSRDNKICTNYKIDDAVMQRLNVADVVLLHASWVKWSASLLPQTIINLGLKPEQRLIVLGRKNFSFGSGGIRRLLSFKKDNLASFRSIKSESHLETNRIMRSNLPANIFVDFHEIICGASNTCPLFTPKGELISYDGGHLTKAGATYLGTKLMSHPAFTDYAKR